MMLLGEDLAAPKLAAIGLALYAVCYGALLVFSVGAFLTAPLAGFIFFGLLGLATTPFFAITHLNRITGIGNGPPARPAVMAIVMAVPSVFWIYTTAANIAPFHYLEVGHIGFLMGFLLMPGLLSLWLCVTFALVAIQSRA